MLDQLTEARDKRQDELAQAEIALLQATAAATDLREEVRRLDAAVAALSGGSPAATEPDARGAGVDEPDSVGSGDDPRSIHELTPEEFDAERKRKQRKKEKEALAASPYAEIPCGACGTKGSLFDTIIKAASGMPIHMTVCSKCNNQMMR